MALPEASVEHLDEGVLLVGVVMEEDPRNDRIAVAFGRIDELEVPPLEEGGTPTVAVKALWMEQAAEHDRPPLSPGPYRVVDLSSRNKRTATPCSGPRRILAGRLRR